jgi:hypothetical protein
MGTCQCSTNSYYDGYPEPIMASSSYVLEPTVATISYSLEWTVAILCSGLDNSIQSLDYSIVIQLYCIGRAGKMIVISAEFLTIDPSRNDPSNYSNDLAVCPKSTTYVYPYH